MSKNIELLSEAWHTSVFLKYIKDVKWGWGFKIPDIARTIKPFDLFYIDEKWVHFTEAKKIKSWVFEFSLLRDNQYTSLKRISSLIKKFWLKNIFSEVLLFDSDWRIHIIDFNKVLQEEEKWKDRIIL